MRTAPAAIASALLLAVVASAADQAARTDAQRPRPLLGLTAEGGAGMALTRFDPRTLAPRDRLGVGEQHGVPAYSPDGSRLAVGVSESPPEGLESPDGRVRVGLWIVDVARLRLVRRVQTGVAVEAVTWPVDDRILAYVQGGEVAVIDADSGRGLSYRRLPSRDCCVEPMAGLPRGAAVLHAPRDEAGHRLLLFDTRGRVRRVDLRRLRLREGATRGALATGGAGRTVFASAPRSPLAVVDTRSRRKRYLPVPRGPRCPSGFACVRERTVVAVAEGHVAVADSLVARRDGEQRTLGRTWLIDTRSRRVRLLARQPQVAYSGGLLVAHGQGLTVFTREGRRRFSAARTRRVWQVNATRTRIYAATENPRPRLLAIDRRTGAVLRRRSGYIRLIPR